MILCACLSPSVFAEDDIPAYHMEDSVFAPAWQLVLQEAGIDARHKDVGLSEARKLFRKGKIVLSCCASLAWRQHPEELQVQVFSEPFFYIINHLILRKGRRYIIPDPSDVRDFKVVIVEGYSFEDNIQFGEVLRAPTLTQALQMVASGKADMTIANNQEFFGHQRIQALPIIMGPEQNRHVLHARVHKSRPDILARINSALARLHKSGQLDMVVAQSLRAGPSEAEPN